MGVGDKPDTVSLRRHPVHSDADTLGRAKTDSTRMRGEPATDPIVGQALMDEIRKPSWVRLRSDGAIGAGGMGDIEAVVDDVLQRRLARKLIHPDLQERQATLQMFIREAQITGRLSHPNIVPVHEIGYDPTGRVYFTMKLIRGNTLAALIDARESVEIERNELFSRLDDIVKVCDALGFAHDNGVLHCDIKPDNIMVGNFGQVYLMDWGVAHIMDAATDSDNWVGEADVDSLILGTAQYMSPEQATGPRAELDQRADLFAVGAALYEILTKRPPYPAGNATATLMNAQSGEMPSVSEVIGRGKVPRALERIVMRALAADRDERYPNVEAFRDDLVQFMRGDGEFPRISVAAGDTVIREGDEGDAAYIIVSGSCEVFQTVDGERTVRRTMGPGEVFGEAALLTDGNRTASVSAAEDTMLMVIARDVLDEELGLVRPWLASLLRTLAARFRDIDTKLRDAQSST
jgi:serine/threonine-protein kinase